MTFRALFLHTSWRQSHSPFSRMNTCRRDHRTYRCCSKSTTFRKENLQLRVLTQWGPEKPMEIIRLTRIDLIHFLFFFLRKNLLEKETNPTTTVAPSYTNETCSLSLSLSPSLPLTLLCGRNLGEPKAPYYSYLIYRQNRGTKTLHLQNPSLNLTLSHIAIQCNTLAIQMDDRRGGSFLHQHQRPSLLEIASKL